MGVLGLAFLLRHWPAISRCCGRVVADGYALDLYWLPLGAGGHSVRVQRPHLRGGGRSPRCAAAAPSVTTSTTRRSTGDDAGGHPTQSRWSAAKALVSAEAADHGAVAGGARGQPPARPLGAVSIRDPLLSVAARSQTSRRRLRAPAAADRRPCSCSGGSVLELVPLRSDLRSGGWTRSQTGEMWNSNSLVSWLLVSHRPDVGRADRLPVGGRAPGWQAGIAVAAPRSPEARRRGASGGWHRRARDRRRRT